MGKQLSLVEARERLQRILRCDGKPIKTHSASKSLGCAMSLEQFPVPGLIKIALTEILGLPADGPFEKVAWAIWSRYQDINFSVHYQKFGPRLYVSSSATTEQVTDLLKALRHCCNTAEQYLQAQIALRLDEARITIENQFHRFYDRYLFFREEAEAAYKAPPPEPIVKESRSDSQFTIMDPFRPQKQGGYLAAAMLDAYFSWLEHLLVLLAPFSDVDFSNGTLSRFVGDTWDAKYRTMFAVATDQSAKAAYDALKRLKETLRNPASHGGFKKDGSTFYFHSTAGALPVLLSRSTNGFEFRISPVPASTFDGLKISLDAITECLEQSSLQDAYRFAKAGLSISFDPEFRAQCREAVSRGEIEHFIEYMSELESRHDNMDY